MACHVVYVALFAITAASATVELNEVFAWKKIDFVWPSTALREQAIEDEVFIPENNLPLGVARWKDRVFITIPKWKTGVASTLNYVKIGGAPDQPLNPYPSMAANLMPDNATKLPSEDSLVSVYRVWVDVCDRLWVLDSAVANLLGTSATIVGPSLAIFDLNTDTLVHRYFFKEADRVEGSFFGNVVVDVAENTCDDAYAYSADLRGGLVVYSLRQGKSWRIDHNYFSFDPLAGEFHMGGVTTHWADGVLGLALSPLQADGFRTLFFHPFTSTKEFAVSTAVLRDDSVAPGNESYYDFKVLGDRGKTSHSPSCFLDPQTGVIFYLQPNNDAISCWNTRHEFHQKNMHIVTKNSTTMLFPSDVKVDDEGNIWMVSDRLPTFMYYSLDYDDVNFRVLQIPVEQAISGTPCA